MKGTYIFLADGFEMTEALATLDVLRRAGINVKTVSISDDPFVTSSHNVTVGPDLLYSEFEAFMVKEGTTSADVMIFPGGMPGTKNLAAHKELMSLMQEHYLAGGSVAAICAAPGLVATKLPNLEGKAMTCYDGFEKNLEEKGAMYVKMPAVTDGNLITGRGAGTAIDFGLAIIAHVKGEDTAKAVKASIML